MAYHDFRRKSVYSIRKLAVGACSVLIGLSFLQGQVAADEGGNLKPESPVETVVEKEAEQPISSTVSSDVEEKLSPGTPAEALVRQPTETANSSEASEVSHPSVANLASHVTEPPKSEATPEHETEVAKPAARLREDFPENKEPVLKPKEIKFDTWADLLAWQPGARTDDAINRSRVPLAERYRGHVINPTANPDAKVEALSNTNSKAADHASVGGEEFKSYAFDYWQYLDSMVFWEGMVPTPDVIDAGHRNGVPVLGTIFYNWSVSAADQERFVESLQKDEKGQFPIARKLVDLAAYYGFDGYFINQETGGDKVNPRGQDMIDFMLDAKKYAAEKGILFKWSWYDAMTYDSGRYHMDGLGEYNAPFMEKHGDQVPADHFFANFNWTKQKNNRSREWADKIQRSPYDVFAGLELQRGGSYKTNVRWGALLNDQGKLALSLGLYAPDTITSLGKTGEDYHKNEDIFWNGYQGDPSKAFLEDRAWRGLAPYIADKTPITSTNFSTSFNTGHGRKYFVDGRVSKDGEWNYRSVAGVLPTWRWWIKSDRPTRLQGSYDFEDAYNGGNSILFSGDVQALNQQDIMLYSTKVAVNEGSRLALTYKSNQGLPLQVALATKADYSEWKSFDLVHQKDWGTQSFSLAELAGQTVYGIKLHLASQDAVKDYRLHLGQLSLFDNQDQPKAPEQVRVVSKALKNAQEAEAIVSFEEVPQADYYEVYAKVGDDWKLLTASSNTSIYLPNLYRPSQASGTEQEIKVHAVGKNGMRSAAANSMFTWGMETSDTTLPRPLAPNVVLGARVIGSSFREKDGGEEIDNMLNGTITSLSDKWSSGELRGTVDIRLTEPRTIVRWAMDHAGAGGESVNDGKMNTRDFDLYFKNEQGEWELAKEIRGNTAHVTDVELPRPITAQDWRLKVITAHNGTPWGAIRIYNWRMYEYADRETVNVPMRQVQAQDLGNGHVAVGFKDVPAYTTVTLYKDREATQVVASKQTRGEQASLLFEDLVLGENLSMLYYRAQGFGLESSNILAVALPKVRKDIASVSIEALPSKTEYAIGDSLDLAGGLLRIHYQGEHEDELLSMKSGLVTVPGYESNRRGEQDLTLRYLGMEVKGMLKVHLKPAVEREVRVLGIKMNRLPKAEYTVGDDLDLTAGRFDVLYDDQTKETHGLTEAQLSGYDPHYVGRQAIQVSYQGFTTTFEILVNPLNKLNDEYVKQKLTEAKEHVESIDYSYNSEVVRQKVRAAVDQAEAVLVPSDTRKQEDLDQALSALTEALSSLDYQAIKAEMISRFTQGKAEVEGLLALLPKEKDRKDIKALLNEPVQIEREALSHLQTRLDQSYQELVAEYLAQPRRKEESHSLKYETIERVNPDLPLGKRKEVQKGVRGVKVDLVEYTPEGKKIVSSRIMVATTPRIVEVGSKPRVTKVTHQIKYRTIVRVNPDLPVGYRRTIQHGIRGTRSDTVEVRGSERVVVGSEVVFAPTDKIIEIGGKVTP